MKEDGEDSEEEKEEGENGRQERLRSNVKKKKQGNMLIGLRILSKNRMHNKENQFM